MEMHYCTLKQQHGSVMILDLHYQKYISHHLINDISYQNASAVTSVVQYLGATSSTIVTFSTKSINRTFPKSICSLKHGQENHNLGCFGGHSCPPELFQKDRLRGEPQKYIGCDMGFICALSTKLKVLYTGERI